MKKQALSIEQMNHLRELGLDTSDASLSWHDTGKGWELKPNIRKKGHIPAYTLEDLLHKLPGEIEDNGFTYVLYLESGDTNRYNMGYRMCMGDELVSTNYQEYAIDAACELLVWCIEEKYVKTEGGGNA